MFDQDNVLDQDLQQRYRKGLFLSNFHWKYYVLRKACFSLNFKSHVSPVVVSRY